MRLMPVKQAQARFMGALGDASLSSIALLTFKKDRSVALERDAAGAWELVEDGFERARIPLPADGAGKRLVKDAFKREFPRSNKLYLTEIKTSAS